MRFRFRFPHRFHFPCPASCEAVSRKIVVDPVLLRLLLELVFKEIMRENQQLVIVKPTFINGDKILFSITYLVFEVQHHRVVET